MSVFNWSQTASSNASADPTINWAEGQAPSSINDSARAMMSAIAKYRDDIAGAITTAGTSTAYTVTSNSGFDTLAHLNGQLIAFTPHTTNGATVTLNVDGLGAKPLRFSPNVEIQSGTIIQGTPYIAVYNNSDGAFYLHGASNQAYAIPLGAGIDYWGSTAPNSCFAFPSGQAISRTAYATLFSLIGTTYGIGDGSTTFNLPDKRGRVSAGVGNMGGTDAGRLSGATVNSIGLGGTGGAETYSLARSDLPNVAPTFSGAESTLDQGNILQFTGTFTANVPNSGGSVQGFNNAAPTKISPTVIPGGTVQSLNGGVTQTAINKIPPLIVCNYIIRII
jgi:microcystin-dependent protein